MLGSTPLTAIIGAAPDPTDHDRIRNYIKTLCEAGMAVVLCYPGTKKPFDGRTVRQRNKDDKEAAAAAKEAGRKGWAKVRSAGGLSLATTDHKVLTKKNGYLDQYTALLSSGGCDSCFDDGRPSNDNTDHSDCQPFEPVAVNIAVEVGKSGLIVVDCDTSEQKAKFLEVSGAPEDMPPTVISPGAQGPDGEWLHYDGGHFYFTAPEGWERPTHMGALTWGGEDGFAILWHQRIVLIPPSQRPEGSYEQAGKEYPADLLPLLIETIESRASAKAERFHDNNTGPTNELASDIDEWAEQVDWAEILEPLGWSMTARPDNCGCDVWTAPGSHSSPKSATAHDSGCSLGRYTETNAPLKIWTDNPGAPFDEYVAQTGHSAISKLQAVAWAQYDGNIGKAMDTLGLGGQGGTELSREMGLESNQTMVDDVAGHDASEDIVLPTTEGMSTEEIADAEQYAPSGQLTKKCYTCDVVEPIENFAVDSDGDWWHAPEGDGANGHLAQLAEDGEDQAEGDRLHVKDQEEPTPFADPGETDVEPDVFDCGVAGVPIIAPFSHWRDMPPPEFIVEGLLEHGGLTCMIGPSGVGKSAVMLDMALCIATGRPWQGRKTLKTRVLYLPGEGMTGTISRMKAWAHEHDVPYEAIEDGMRIGNDIIRARASGEAWGAICEYMIRQRIGLIIFDTFARMATGIEENSATEVGNAIVRLDNVRKLTNAGAMLIHHTGKNDPKTGRGSSALNAALDSELLVSEASWTYEDMGYDVNDVTRTPPTGKPLELMTTKQKNAQQLEEPIPLLMRSSAHIDAPYITGPGGTVDPMMGTVTLARPRPEPLVETAIRIKAYLAQFTDLQPSKAEIARDVMPDPYTKSRTDSAKAWKQTINLALDLGMRYGLIDHPVNDNDTTLTTKFIVGTSTDESARNQHVKSVLGEDD